MPLMTLFILIVYLFVYLFVYFVEEEYGETINDYARPYGAMDSINVERLDMDKISINKKVCKKIHLSVSSS